MSPQWDLNQLPAVFSGYIHSTRSRVTSLFTRLQAVADPSHIRVSQRTLTIPQPFERSGLRDNALSSP